MSIILVPTSHVAEESVRKIKEVIEKIKPDCVAVELDKNRYLALKHKESSGSPSRGLKQTSSVSIQTFGFTTNLIFKLLKKLQEKIGDIVGIMPGSDMLTAVETAKGKNIPVYFIDQDIQQTLEGLKSLKFSEKLKLIKYALTASFYVYTGRGGEIKGTKATKSLSNQGFDLTKVPPEKLIDEALEVFKINFPQLYKILVEDRNQYMAANLKKLSENYKTVVCVVGAGHYKGLKVLLQSK